MLRKLRSYLVLTLCIVVADAYGQLWESMNGPGGSYCWSTTTTPNGDIYIVSDHTIHRSTDIGSTWHIVAPQVRFSASPSHPRLVSSNDGTLYLRTRTELWCSTDDGTTWEMRRNVSTTSGMAVTPSGDVIVSALIDTICISTDKGVSWRNVHPGDGYIMGEVYTDVEGTIYALSNYDFFISTNNGVDWTKISTTSLPSFPENFVSVKPGRLITPKGQSLYSSSDHGETWFHIYQANSVIRSLVRVTEDTLFLLTEEVAIERSTDGGQTWSQFSDSMTPASVTMAQLSYSKGSFIVKFTSEIFRCSVSDGMCEEINIPNGAVDQLALIPSGKMYVASVATSPSSSKQSLWVHDQTSGWQKDNYLAFTTSVSQVSVDSNGTLLVIRNGTVMARSTGEWEFLANFDNAASLVTSRDTMILFDNNNKARFTKDFGKTWQDLAPPAYEYFATAVAQPSVVYLAGELHFSRSLDWGATWEEINFPYILGSGPTRAMYARNNVVVVGVDNTGTYFSSNYGQTWENHSQGLARDTIFQLIGVPEGPLFAATSSGVYEYLWEKQQWKNINDGMFPNTVIGLTLGTDGKLYAGTQGNGVFRSTKTYGPIRSFVIEQAGPSITIFPNPASSAVQVKIGTHTERYMVKIYNLVGQVMLASDRQELLDVSALPSGRYFLRVSMENGVLMKPLTIRR